MIFKYFLSFLLLFLYLTQVRSVFFTFPIFYFLSIMGLFVLLLQIVKNRVDRNLFFIILINLSMIVLQMFSFIINEGGDFKFLREVILYNFLSMLFCLFFYNLSVNSKFDFNYIYLISSAVLLQLILSLFAFFNSSFFDLLFSVFPQNLGSGDLDEFNVLRMVTLGTPFFGSAVLSSIVLLLLSQHINNTKKTNPYLLSIFIIISILSILSARTAIVGVFLSLILILSNLKNNYKYILISLPIFIILYYFINNFSSDSRANDIINFGFEFIYNYKDSQASESVDGVSKMFSVLPDDLKTWLIGDGYFKASNDLAYYKNIDIGFLRVIFNFGLIGLFVFIYLNYFIIKKIDKAYLSKKAKFLVLICFGLLMIKGLANIFPYLMLIYTLGLIKKDRSRRYDLNRNSLL